MNRSRRTSTHISYTTRRGRSLCFFRETQEVPDYRSPPTFAISPYTYPQGYSYVPPLVPSQGSYSGHSYYQSPVLPYQPTPSITHFQQHSQAHSIYDPPSAYQRGPEGQFGRDDQGSNHASLRYPSHPTLPVPGTTIRDIQSWIDGTVQTNTSSPNSFRTHLQCAGLASDPIGQHEDWGQRRNRERVRCGSSYTPSYPSGTDDGSWAGGRTVSSQPDYLCNNPTPNGPRYPVAMFLVNGQPQTFYASSSP